MKLKIWQDEKGHRHTSLDGVEISMILTGLDLYNSALEPTKVNISILPSGIEVELTADVSIIIDGFRHRLVSIKKEQASEVSKM